MENKYLDSINTKETNELLVSLKMFALENKVPIITDEGIKFLNQIIAISNVKRVLEIGTAIGYSAINMAMNNDISIVSIELDNEAYNIALKNIEKANLSKRVKLINNDALEVDETTLGNFDLIFIDAAKAQNVKFFEKYKTILNSKGIIITDNLLFHDLVDQEIGDRNLRQLMRKIDNFNKFVVKAPGFDTYIYQLGDGMSLSIKRK